MHKKTVTFRKLQTKQITTTHTFVSTDLRHYPQQRTVGWSDGREKDGELFGLEKNIKLEINISLLKKLSVNAPNLSVLHFV